MKFTNNKSYFYANVSFLNFENSLKIKINNEKRFDIQTIIRIYFDYQMIWYSNSLGESNGNNSSEN